MSGVSLHAGRAGYSPLEEEAWELFERLVYLLQEPRWHGGSYGWAMLQHGSERWNIRKTADFGRDEVVCSRLPPAMEEEYRSSNRRPKTKRQKRPNDLHGLGQRKRGESMTW